MDGLVEVGGWTNGERDEWRRGGKRLLPNRVLRTQPDLAPLVLTPHRVLRTQPALSDSSNPTGATTSCLSSSKPSVSTGTHTLRVLTPYRILRIQPERQQVVTPHRASLNRNSNKFSFHPTTTIFLICGDPLQFVPSASMLPFSSAPIRNKEAGEWMDGLVNGRMNGGKGEREREREG